MFCSTGQLRWRLLQVGIPRIVASFVCWEPLLTPQILTPVGVGLLLPKQLMVLFKVISCRARWCLGQQNKQTVGRVPRQYWMGVLCDRRVMKLYLSPSAFLRIWDFGIWAPLRYETSDYGSLCVQVVGCSGFAIGDVNVPLQLGRRLSMEWHFALWSVMKITRIM